MFQPLPRALVTYKKYRVEMKYEGVCEPWAQNYPNEFMHPWDIMGFYVNEYDDIIIRTEERTSRLLLVHVWNKIEEVKLPYLNELRSVVSSQS